MIRLVLFYRRYQNGRRPVNWPYLKVNLDWFGGCDIVNLKNRIFLYNTTGGADGVWAFANAQKNYENISQRKINENPVSFYKILCLNSCSRLSKSCLQILHCQKMYLWNRDLLEEDKASVWMFVNSTHWTQHDIDDLKEIPNSHVLSRWTILR